METTQNTFYGECRCCLAKGHHRDIMKEYYCNGIREVYYDIFMDCYNLFLSTDASLSSLICLSCVQRLREASSFRMMVVGTERQLVDALKDTDDKSMVFVRVPVADTASDAMKQEEQASVKEEPSESDADDDPDYAPVETLAEPDLAPLSRASREAALLARGGKRLPDRAALYYLSCAGYARRLDDLKDVLITSTTIAQLLKNDLRPTKNKLKASKVYVTEKMGLIMNASMLLEHSNITPFKSKSRNGFPCFYCRSIFENLIKLREHTIQQHKKSELKKVLATYGAESMVVYVDVTDLQCNICSKQIPNLNELKSHLIKTHNKKIYLEYTDRVIPFKLNSNNLYECQICGFNFETFGSIERHMNVHFRNYVCKDCGTGFVTKYRLKVHVKSMHGVGNFPCEICKKVYTTHQKHKNHVDTVHKNVKRFKCTKCPERFSEYFRRQKHMVEQHGVAPLQYKCNVCEKSFDRRYTLSRHMKRDHLEERDFQCSMCTYKCFTNNELRVHMIKHTGERIYECCVCKKSYARKKTLKEHMRIHNNDRRFVCAVCGQAFVQKCSLKGHLKTHHHTYSNTLQ